MKYVKGYKLFESNETIINDCLDILIDIRDNDIPVNIKYGSVYRDTDILVEIGDDDSNAFKNRFWHFNEYVSQLNRLNQYLESEGYKLDDSFIYYESYYNRGSWNRYSTSFKKIDDLIFELSLLKKEKIISFIDLVFKKINSKTFTV